jgi:putative salt-induced outer membrane protein YdiY
MSSPIRSTSATVTPTLHAFFLALLALILLAAPSAQAAMDRIELLNGSLIIGRFIDADNGKVMVETEFAGTLEIDQNRIAAMDVASPLTLQMEDGSVLETSNLVVADSTLTVDDDDAAMRYAIDQLMRINPEPWELGRGYNSSGSASGAVTLQRGNTVIDELDYRVDSRWQGLNDRYTLRLEGEVREANRERTAENWLIRGKYDRLQVGDYYWGVAASAEENRFADLDLRTNIGPYVGRELLESSQFPLELELGLSQINENFGSADDRSYVGLTWNLQSESNYLGGDSRLYLDHKGVKNLADRNNLILNTTLGLSFPLLGQIQGSTELVLNYNSGAVAGTEELDQTYRIRIGYSW